jgi:phenylalanyl-tRNA synthetase beta chain
MLGLTIPEKEIETILKSLGFLCQKTSDGWDVTVPARRFDIKLEIDLIEELIRLYGYDKLPTHQSAAAMQINPRPENKINLSTIRRTLCDLGFNEVITYSFIDKKLQTVFDPDNQPKELLNPITSEMTVMRTTLWPGLINTLIYNLNRQQPRAKLFESGLRFLLKENQLIQQRMLSGLSYGNAYPEQWGIPNRDVDFFDLKGDLQNLLKLTLSDNEFTFKPGSHPALHPGQTAEIYRGDKKIGILGALHPSIVQALDIPKKVFLFEIALDELETAKLPYSKEISKFPENRRDIAILVDRAVPAQLIQDTIKEVAGELLQDVNVFDIYQGKGIAADRKSIALALTLQHASRTLRDEEVADLIERVIVALKDRFAAELRG